MSFILFLKYYIQNFYFISILFFDTFNILLSNIKYAVKYRVMTIIELITIFNKLG